MTVRSDRGTTLIELVAVLAIFSVVAVMALQGLGSAIAARQRLAAAETVSAALAGTAALLRRDLEAMVPVPGPDGEAAFAADSSGFALTLAHQPDFPEGARGGLVRVNWRVDAGHLSRQVRPFEGEAATSGTLLESVSAWRIRSRTPSGAWQDGDSAVRGARRVLPSAVEVVFDLPSAAGIRLLVAR